MKVFYDERMVARSPGFSPSAAKPKQVVDDWTEHAIPIEVVTFQPATREHLKLAHDRGLRRRHLGWEICERARKLRSGRRPLHALDRRQSVRGRGRSPIQRRRLFAVQRFSPRLLERKRRFLHVQRPDGDGDSTAQRRLGGPRRHRGLRLPLWRWHRRTSSASFVSKTP